MLHAAAFGLIQQHIFTGTRDDGEEIVSYHACHLVAVAAGEGTAELFHMGGGVGTAAAGEEGVDTVVDLQVGAGTDAVACGTDGVAAVG